MSSMTNSYTWVASALNLNRLYFKSFQILIQAPVPASAVMVGEVLAGMVKGLFAAGLIITVGFFSAPHFSLTPLLGIALLLNCFLFASLGVVTGMITKTHEDTATYNNFFILPMAFFSGTFFPIEKIPDIFRPFVWILPLTHSNIVMRSQSLNWESVASLVILVGYAMLFFITGERLIRNYSE